LLHEANHKRRGVVSIGRKADGIQDGGKVSIGDVEVLSVAPIRHQGSVCCDIADVTGVTTHATGDKEKRVECRVEASTVDEEGGAHTAEHLGETRCRGDEGAIQGVGGYGADPKDDAVIWCCVAAE
jgi:hypothetical protein